MDNALGLQLYNMIYNNSDSITKSVNWLNWFHGLCISALPPTGAGNIYGFSDSCLMRIHYHEVGASTTLKTIDFGITNTSFQFNNIITDRKTSPLNKLDTPTLAQQTPPATPDSLLNHAGYVQSITA